MPLSVGETQLLRLSKSRKQEIETLRLGAYVVEVTGRPLTELQHQVCADRLRLADEFAAAGDRMMRMRPRECRSAVSRYYYSMYHAMRAVVYFANSGDDHEAHSELPRHTPDDFPQGAIWENRLKDARGRRNDADYDPYPQSPADFAPIARALGGFAHALAAEARNYLRSKGCAYV